MGQQYPLGPYSNITPALFSCLNLNYIIISVARNREGWKKMEDATPWGDNIYGEIENLSFNQKLRIREKNLQRFSLYNSRTQLKLFQSLSLF